MSYISTIGTNKNSTVNYKDVHIKKTPCYVCQCRFSLVLVFCNEETFLSLSFAVQSHFFLCPLQCRVISFFVRCSAESFSSLSFAVQNLNKCQMCSLIRMNNNNKKKGPIIFKTDNSNDYEITQRYLVMYYRIFS